MRNRNIDPIQAYIIEFQQRMTMILAPKYRSDADDIAQREVERLLKRTKLVMEAYPSPTTYAMVRAKHAGQDHLRRMAVQQGLGAATFQDAEGNWTRHRSSISGDAPLGADVALTLFDTLPASGDMEEQLVESIERHRMLQQAMISVPRKQMQALALVDGYEYTTIEAGDMLGTARETVSRNKQKALKALVAA